MTFVKFDTLNAPAQRSARQLLVAVSSLSLMGMASFASAQSSVPFTASAQQTATLAQQDSDVVDPAVEDKYKPRIYGGTQPTVTPPGPTATPEPIIRTSPTPDTLPKMAPTQAEQQVNVIASEFTSTPSANAANTASIPDVNPGLAANSELNSAPDWTNGIRAQFIDVIAGVPIIKDPTTCSDGNPGINIKVVNVKKTEGVIVADLHNDVKENFLVWDEVLLRVRATATKDETTFCMPVPKGGDYSIAIYHDKNSNAVFDKNFLGLPKERFGMSNNPKFTTKSPKYEQATFTVPEAGMDMLIKLRRAKDVISGNQD